MGRKCDIRALEYFPPGYEYEKERIAAGLLLVLPMLFGLRYFAELYEEVCSLYYVERLLGRTVRAGAEADSFFRLAGGYGSLFLPYFLFLAIMAAYRYGYFYRETKCIYLMKRLPGRWILARSCLQASLLGMAVGVAAVMILFVLYYGAYLLFVPAECHPRFL